MYNKVIMIGRLTAQPELVTTPTEKSVTRVTLAVNRRFKSQNGEREGFCCKVLNLLSNKVE